jgi:glycosyltransferase involved in cell wall biosynthesis
MALGKVVISTDMGGPREIIDNYNNGMLVSPSPDLLSNAILNALDDKSLYDRISSNAKIKAKDFDVKKYIEKIKSVYANLIGKYSKNIKISALLIVRNEEKKIERVLQSLKWCDEIVVVDQSSTDKTCEIASKYTDKIFITEPKGVCEPDRKFGISKAKFDWVIMMDADEILNKDNINEIKNMISLGLYDVLMMKRRNYFLGKWIKTCGWYPTFVPRIFKKGSVDFGDNIHNDGLVLSDRVYYLKNDVDHFSYDSIDDWIDKFKRYTSRHADEYYRNGIKLNTKNFIREVILRPVYFFLLDYIRFKGFKDGWRGFFISLSSSLTVMFSYFKLIEIYEKKK